MSMPKSVACLSLLLVGCTFAYPVTQPVYASPQYYTTAPQQQAQQQVQYRQPLYYTAQAPQAHPVVEQTDPQPQYVAQQAGPLNQPLLGTVDRQIQKVAHYAAGPYYAQQVQSVQLAGQAQQAQDQVQRNALRLATAPRAQPLQYQRALQPVAAAARHRPQEEEEQQEDYNSNPSYQFGFDVKDDLYTNYQNRKEQREGDKITGSYSVVDSDGFIRTVTYTADAKEGFKAEVTRQPTDIVVKVPQPQPQYQHQPEQLQRQPQYAEAAAPVPQYERQPQHQQQQQQQQQPRYVYQYQ